MTTLADAVVKAVADYLHYFHGVTLDDRAKRKMRDEWIAPTIKDAVKEFFR